MFNVIFHIGIKEPPSEALQRWLKEHENGKHKNFKVRWNGSERKGEVLFIITFDFFDPDLCY